MTDEQKLEPDEQEDVEAHSTLSAEPELERERADDEGEDVEGHVASFKPELP